MFLWDLWLFSKQLWMIKRSEFNVMNDTVNNKKGHNIMNNSFAHKPDRLLVNVIVCWLFWRIPVPKATNALQSLYQNNNFITFTLLPSCFHDCLTSSIFSNSSSLNGTSASTSYTERQLPAESHRSPMYLKFYRTCFIVSLHCKATCLLRPILIQLIVMPNADILILHSLK